ncbi:hypothetical protein AABM26_08430 [Curtobacterium aetherium]|uniref:hypothetical protein n=1 Tax=Curtobacterium aetherium TaxID=2841594 RepID=UPI003B520D82
MRSEDHHGDPTASDFGATTFGAAGADSLTAVEDHGVHTEQGAGYLDTDTGSLDDVALATTGHGDAMTPSAPKGATPIETASGYPFGLASR